VTPISTVAIAPAVRKTIHPSRYAIRQPRQL
jgi:hypothetical protein